MSYVTPVTNHTSSGYFNVTDWTRIYGNAQVTSSLASIMLGTPITFTAVTTPTTTTTPTSILSMVDTLLVNIELMRLAMVALIPTLTEIKDDWGAGADQDALTYVHVNQWETTIDAIWEYFGGPDLDVDLILSADLTILTGETLVVVDSLDAATYAIDIQDTGALYII